MVNILNETMKSILDILGDKLQNLTTITIGSSVGGTALGVASETLENTPLIIVNGDLLSILQYVAYGISIMVGILTIITWCKKNIKKKN